LLDLELNSSPVWSPRLVRDKAMVERVQKRFAKCLPGFCHFGYAKRLQLLKLESLEARCVKADLVLCHKIVLGHVDTDKNKLAYF